MSRRVAIRSSASESSVKGALGWSGVVVHGAVLLMLGSISAPYTRVFVPPYSSKRERSEARTTSKSSALRIPPPVAPRGRRRARNSTSSNDKQWLALIAVKREMKKNKRAPPARRGVRLVTTRARNPSRSLAVGAGAKAHAEAGTVRRKTNARRRHHRYGKKTSRAAGTTGTSR